MMKSLTLLRHAKSEAASPSGRDFDRSLNERGNADAKRIGEEIRRLGLAFDLVLVSPARRTVETVEAVGGLSPEYEPRIYEAPVDQLLEITRAVNNSVERLLMVGHNPGFELLAGMLSADGVDDFPTAALVEIELPVNDWRQVGVGTVTRFISPRTLA